MFQWNTKWNNKLIAHFIYLPEVEAGSNIVTIFYTRKAKAFSIGKPATGLVWARDLPLI